MVRPFRRKGLYRLEGVTAAGIWWNGELDFKMIGKTPSDD